MYMTKTTHCTTQSLYNCHNCHTNHTLYNCHNCHMNHSCHTNHNYRKCLYWSWWMSIRYTTNYWILYNIHYRLPSPIECRSWCLFSYHILYPTWYRILYHFWCRNMYRCYMYRYNQSDTMRFYHN